MSDSGSVRETHGRPESQLWRSAEVATRRCYIMR